MVGRVLTHYRIQEKLGEGGMGAVYRAWDERLKRVVALKVISETAFGRASPQRILKNEAAALLRLSHPHIGILFDFDSANGIDFIVMEFVPGRTLEQRLVSGPMSLSEAIPIAVQIAEAIEEAHELGVIHRDLKPANVMVSPKGQVKVLDFGLAHLLRREGGAAKSLIRTGSRLDSVVLGGTLPYMAPEEILARVADARADIYAFGVVLYEMLTGERPFKGDTEHSLTNAILNQQAVPPRRLAPDLPAPLEKLILRCLEKEPGHRYATLSDMLRDLRPLVATSASIVPEFRRPRVRSAAIAVAAVLVALLLIVLVLDLGGSRRLFGRQPVIRSIAVLPLANLSSDPQQEFFADGMTDALIGRLGRIGSLRVISRTSVMRFKGSRASLRDIARQLRVDAVVEGSVLRSGDAVRINAQLVEAATDRQLWSEDYERRVEDVLALQREVAEAISAAVRVSLPQDERTRLIGGRTAVAKAPNPTAEEAYLKGRYYASKPSEAMLRISLRFFEQATATDSNYAAAWAGLANSYVLLASSGGEPLAREFELAKQAAQRALALDAGLSEAHVWLGLARFYGDWNWSAAEHEFRRAIEISPGNAQAHNWYSGFLSAMGRHDQAIAEARRAMELDPLSMAIQVNVGLRFYYARQYAEAVESLNRTLELEPQLTAAHYWLGLALQQQGKTAEAIQEYRLVGGAGAIGPLGFAYATSGNRAEASRMLDELGALAKSGQASISPPELAMICVGLGQKDQAFEWLNQALQQRATYLTTVKVDPLLDPLRSDPRFAALLKRVGTPA